MARVRIVGLFSQDTKVAALKRAPLFANLSRKELALLAQNSEDLEVPAGKVLCKQGSVGHEFFAIVEGEVEVERDGKPVEIDGGTEFFGEVALISHVERTATVRAKTPLRFFVLTGSSFHRLMDDSPEVKENVMKAVAARLAEASEAPTI